jgi:hypothetical protein
VVATVLNLLASIDETLTETNASRPAALAGVGAEMIRALETIAARLEAKLDTINETLEGGLARLAARVSETTARVVELSDNTATLHRSFVEQLQFLDSSRVNIKDSVRRLDREVDTLVLDLKELKGE